MERFADQTVWIEQVQVVAFQAERLDVEDIAFEIALVAPRAIVLKSKASDCGQSIIDVTVEIADDSALFDRVVGVIFHLTAGSRIRVHRDMRGRQSAPVAMRASSCRRDGASSWKHAASALR